MERGPAFPYVTPSSCDERMVTPSQIFLFRGVVEIGTDWVLDTRVLRRSGGRQIFPMAILVRYNPRSQVLARFPSRRWWTLWFWGWFSPLAGWCYRVGLWDVPLEGDLYSSGHLRLDFWRTRRDRARIFESLVRQRQLGYEAGWREGREAQIKEILADLDTKRRAAWTAV